MATDSTLVVTAYDEREHADQAIDALREEGFGAQEIEVLKGTGDTLVSELTRRGFGKEDARDFAEAAEDGKTLVAAQIPDEKADRAMSIMQRFETSEENEAGSEKAVTKGRGREQTVPIAEEGLSVEKYKVGQGGVRVSSKVKEQPVEESVTLREEHVEAERRPTDRPLKGEEAEAAFEEKTVEMMGSREEAEIRKEARVTGEVALTRETTEREEKVRDKVRSTDVEVEEIKASRKRK
jgi:stress response protein YsnF